MVINNKSQGCVTPCLKCSGGSTGKHPTPEGPDIQKSHLLSITFTKDPIKGNFSTSLRCTFRVVANENKNSSGDEIANVNFLRRYGTYVLQNTKKENLLRLTN